MQNSSEIFANNEFDKMMFNVYRVPHNRSVLKSFATLSKLPELRRRIYTGLDKNKVLRYICFMYDKNSPLRKRFPNIMKRKIESARLAGFNLEEGGIFAENIEDMLSGKNNSVNNMIVSIVRAHRNVKYSYLVSIEESFYFMMEEVVGGEMKNMGRLKDVQNEIEETVLEMMNEDDNPLIKEELFKYMEEERLNLRPEDIARQNRKRNEESEGDNTEES